MRKGISFVQVLVVAVVLATVVFALVSALRPKTQMTADGAGDPL